MSWVGARYRHQGRDRVRGLDCAGLIARVGNDTGAMAYDDVHYRRFPTAGDFYKVFEKSGCQRKPLRDRLPGDIITLRVHEIACHLGILVDNDHFVHAFARSRRVVLCPYDDEWQMATDRCYEFPSVE